MDKTEIATELTLAITDKIVANCKANFDTVATDYAQNIVTAYNHILENLKD